MISTFGDSIAAAQRSAACSALRCPRAASRRGLKASATSGTARHDGFCGSVAGDTLEAVDGLLLEFDVVQEASRDGYGLVAAEERKMPQRDGPRPAGLPVGGEKDELLDDGVSASAAGLLSHAVNEAFEGFVRRFAYAGLIRNQKFAERRNHFRVDFASAAPGRKPNFGVIAADFRQEFFRFGLHVGCPL